MGDVPVRRDFPLQRVSEDINPVQQTHYPVPMDSDAGLKRHYPAPADFDGNLKRHYGPVPMDSDTTLRASHREHKRDTSEKTGNSPSTPPLSPLPPSPPYKPAPHAEHGPLIDRSMTAEAKARNAFNSGLAWPRIRSTLKTPFAEFMGTFILVMFGDGVVAQVILSGNDAGNYQSISWGWGIGVMLGVYASGISGAHINPAVTLANCVFRKFPWKMLVPYIIAQVLGAMCAAFVVYGNYYSAIDALEGGSGIRTVSGPTATAGIFCTYPQPFMTTTGMFFSEFVASTLLMFLIYCLKDDANLGAGNLVPLGLFFVIFGIGACFGWETGYAINLARDFGPRLVSYIVGYGPEVWTAGNYYFWIPMVAPFLGCLFGGFLYDSFLYVGESPINLPYMGLYRFVPDSLGVVDKVGLEGRRWDHEGRRVEESPV